MNDGHAPQTDYSAGALTALADVLHHTSEQYRKLQGNSASAEDVRALLAAARSAFAQLSKEYGGQVEVAPVVSLGDLVEGYWEQVAARKLAAPTGLGALDEALGGGFQSGKLLVLLGAPGSGKTTLANQIAEHVADGGRPVLYVTSEDPPMMLLAKTLARLGGLDYGAVLGGYKGYKEAINRTLALIAARRSAQTLLYLHDAGNLTIEAIQEQARAHFARYTEGGPGLLVIDYLQRLARSLRMGGWQGIELREAVTRLAECLRSVSLELDCTILALASQNRGGYGTSNALASAKESGDIEYTADVMLALAEGDKGKAAPNHTALTLRLVKNRLGPSGHDVTLDWWAERQQFSGVES